mgnify:CR=1 FL=1
MKERTMQALRVFVAVLFTMTLSTLTQANICLSIDLPNSHQYTIDSNIEIISSDGVTLAANIFTPTTAPSPDGYPAIIFVNSWMLDEHEYLIQASQFAKKGYIVLSYTSRGWGCSGGEIGMSGPTDTADITAIVDWLEAKTDTDMNNIGISGMSYGAGLSLAGLALEPRLKTAVAMSAWGSVEQILYAQETPHLFWGAFLVASGTLTATIPPAIIENFTNMVSHKNIDSAIKWTKAISPINSIDLINERNAPVYIANNFGDNMFPINDILTYYSQLTVPKRLDINQGMHASGEVIGLLGVPNYTWDNAHDWFDYWLKGEATGIMDRPSVTMERDLSTERDEFSNWPIPETETKTFYFGARGLLKNGKLRETPYKPWWPKINTIFSGLDSGASTGIPILSALIDGHLKTPVFQSIPLINRVNGIVFQTSKLDDTLKIRGIPSLKINITPSSSKMQLIGYLYDVDAFGIGKLITHGPISLHDTAPWQRIELDMTLVATSYDVPKGHRLAIALDTFDTLYGVPTLTPYSIGFNYSRKYQSVLNIPIID